jgi:hypothetical protein
MSDSPSDDSRPEIRPYLLTLILVNVVMLGFSGWANLSWEITDPAEFRHIPPFKPGFDRNDNRHLGAEYFTIANAIADGRGFSDPFNTGAGPTAWMPPILCWLEAGLLKAFDRNINDVMNSMICLQLVSLGLALWIVLLYCDQSPRWWVALVLIFQMMMHFRYAFQVTHDCGYLMLVVDLMLLGLGWGQVFTTRWRSILWGLFGGLAALSSPILGLCWVVLSWVQSWGQRKRFFLAFAAMLLAISPWVVRNYLVFGKLIPVKSNLAYELYQSQCLQDSGVLMAKTFGTHPWGRNSPARWEYDKVGEIEFLQRREKLFWEAVRNDPGDFFRRVWERFLAVTLVYEPHEPEREAEFVEAMQATYVTHPLPFLGWLMLLYLYLRFGLSPLEKVVFWFYLVYLAPYVIVSYYSRYEYPILGVKWMLMIWLGDRSVRLIRRVLGR